MRFRLKRTSGITFTEVDVQQEAKEIDQVVEKELERLMPQDTVQAISPTLSAFGKQAAKVRQKIQYFQKIISSLTKRGDQNMEQQVLLQKQYSLLGQSLKEGYRIVMKMREYVTKERVGYGIRIASGEQESLGIYSIDEMLQMTTLIESTENALRLGFENVDAINAAANQKNKVTEEITDELSSVLSNYRTIRKNVIGKRARTRQLQIKEGVPDDKLIAIYYPGMGGFILERAFVAQAKGQNAKRIYSFQSDQDRYSSGGDLQRNEVVYKLKKYYDNIEVKNVTGYGASLVDLNSLMRDLNKIVEICYKCKAKTEESFKNKLNKEIFKNKKHVQNISQELANKLNEIDEKVLKAFSLDEK